MLPSVRLANLALAALAREWEQHETSNPDSDVSGSGSCSSHSTCDLPANTEESMALANATLAMHAVSALAASVNAHANAVVVAKTLDRKDDAAHLHELNNNMKLMRQARVLAGATATAAENKARHWYGKQNEVARGENGKAHPV
ncbi:hypothetical protein CC85DRAFT_209655 [Cutaneotrichosporon oleaginosum]|uniref:Uncharacterized protein n=1 Tax=Cutaneotrichosporon oleaginosum TaxID=879819 RepID=A0A0J0XD70_9TREE|nr:uncharacterized protein CC85DRAFT_209655 [Cutaneotrichosporon oleaginosum]KLT38997.1 hypothetical protein CC85DRAFT_209655 [Cutaneotrichosporon oleaginosum]TXT08304.1 hypothetical protein COLE_05228 [Cutaneotrichosporon oleaginosum]